MAYIAGLLEKNGYSVQTLDANFYQLIIPEINEEIGKSQPDIIGLYVTTMGYYKVKDLATVIKEQCSNLPIMIGGPHLSVMD